MEASLTQARWERLLHKTRKTDASLKLSSLDLAPYLAYIPASLPVKLKSAVLDADIKVAFEQSPAIAVNLSGLLQASKVNIMGPSPQDGSAKDKQTDDEPLLAFDQLKLSLANVRPLERLMHLTAIESTGPTLSVHRAKSGQLNLTPLSRHQNTPEKIASTQDITTAKAENDAKKGDWKLTVDKVLMRGGSINWQDDAPAPSVHAGLRDVALDASGIAFPFAKPSQVALPMYCPATTRQGMRPARTRWRPRAPDSVFPARPQIRPPPSV